MVLSAVACRALIEKDAGKPGAEKLREDVVQWLTNIGIAGEMEAAEATLLSTPLGKLDRRSAIDASWSAEGMVVLAWVLGRASLPMFDVQCEPSEVANAMGFLAERESTVLPHPLLRDASEVSVGEETYLTLHWRLRQFSTDSKPHGFSRVCGCMRLGTVKAGSGEVVRG